MYSALSVTPDEALARAAEAGIHCIPVPTPFAVGRVNCYLIDDDPLTLVDTGPNSGKALDELQRQLGERGHSIDDIELVFITHQHIDHLGLTEIIVEHSGAAVAALDLAVKRLANFAPDAERDDRFAGELMRRHGIDENVVIALQSMSQSFRAWGSRVQVTKPIADGGTLELRDRSFEILHRPGHSPTDTLLWDEERSILLAADHLIKHISSNALLTRPLDGEEERTRALVTYIESMRRTRELPADVVLSGHGDPITDHAALIDSRLTAHERRKNRLLRLITEQPRTGHELAHALWGNVAVTQAFLTLSEVIGHVDLLLDEGTVREVEEAGVVRFHAC